MPRPEPCYEDDETDSDELGEAPKPATVSIQPERAPLKQRWARVADALEADPSRSNRAIASECGVSDKTVAVVRAELGAGTPNPSA